MLTLCWDISPCTLSVPRSEQFSESKARGNLSHEEQIMFKNKYLSIFSHQIEAIMFIILQIFFVTRAVLKIREYHSDNAQGIFIHVKSFDQSRASENMFFASLAKGDFERNHSYANVFHFTLSSIPASQSYFHEESSYRGLVLKLTRKNSELGKYIV